MLHFKPDLVDLSAAENFVSTAESATIPPIGPVSYGWIASDLNSKGTVGEAHLATAEKGKIAAKHQISGFIDLLRQVRDQPIGEFAPSLSANEGTF